jgi:hypothetical protein
LALLGFSDEQVKEAGWVVKNLTGQSAYLYGIGYSVEKQKQEVEAIVEHIEKSAQD